MAAAHAASGYDHDYDYQHLHHRHRPNDDLSSERAHTHNGKHGDHAHDHPNNNGHHHLHHGHSHGRGCNDHGHSHGDGIWAYLPHGHGLHTRIAADRRSLQLACGILFVSLFAQLLGGFAADSPVLEAEAVHTLLDGLVIILSLLSIALASRPSSARYTFGLARAEVLSALVSVLALALMCVNLVTGAVQRLPDAIRAAGGAAAVAAKGRAVLIAEAVTLVNNILIACVLEGSSLSLNIRALRAHVVSDSVGNVVVLVAGAVMWAYPRMAVLDPALTILLVVCIVAFNVGMARETLEVLMQAAPPGVDMNGLERKVRGLNGVAEVQNCHVWTLTTGVVVASVKVFMDDAVRDRSEFQLLQEETERVFLDAGVDDVTVQVRYSRPRSESDDGGVVVEPGDVRRSNSLGSKTSYALVETEEV